MFKKWWFWLLVIIVVGAIAVGSNSKESDIEKEDTKKEKQEVKKDDKKREVQQLKVGETVNFDGVKVTLNSVRVVKGGQLDKSEKGQFVVVNLTAENTKKEEQTISSVMNVELFDKDGYKYNTTILTEGTQGQFDGQVVSGGKLRGEIPFDVPVSDKYELHFSNPFKDGKAIWMINASDIKK